MLKRLSIRLKLFLLVLVVLIPLILLQFSSIKRMLSIQVENQYLTYEVVAEAVSTSFLNYLHELWTQEEIIGTFFTMNPHLTRDEIRAYLIDVQKKSDTLSSFNWVAPDGKVLASSMNAFNESTIENRSFYKEILKGEKCVISELLISYIDNKPIVPVACAIKNNDGELVGIVSAAIDINKLGSRLPSPSINPGIRFTLVDQSGLIVYKSNTADLPMESRKIHENSPVWDSLNRKIIRVENSKSVISGNARIAISYPIKKIGWACSVSSPNDDLMKKLNQSAMEDKFILYIIVVLSLLVALVIGNSILNPLTKIRAAASAIKDGDYSARVQVDGSDELAVTAQTFDMMAENIEQYDKIKSQFFTNLSHELKTPLNVVLASTQLLNTIKPVEPCPAHGKIKVQLKVIQQNCYRLIRMINNLIDISKHDVGFLKIKPGNHNIVYLVENIAMSIVKYAETKGIEVIFDTEMEEKVIACDPDAIERIMLNLLSNALKFTNPSGNIYITLLDKNDRVEISVKDTGIGIPQDKLDIIFERFGQVDSSLSRNHEGSGIGLSLVKALVEAHNGKITVTSEIEKGTEFIITLPVNVLPEDISTDRSLAERTEKSIVEKIHIEFSDIYSIRGMD